MEEGFLELINNMLTIGMVPALFDEDGKKAMCDKVRDEAKKKGMGETTTQASTGSSAGRRRRLPQLQTTSSRMWTYPLSIDRASLNRSC